jgi:hypothetical protein
VAGVGTSRYAGNDPVNASDPGGHHILGTGAGVQMGGDGNFHDHMGTSNGDVKTDSVGTGIGGIQGVRIDLIITTDPGVPGDAWGECRDAAEDQATSTLPLDGRVFEDAATVAEVQEALENEHYTIDELYVIGHSGHAGVYVGSRNIRGTNISSNGSQNDVSPSDINWSNVSGSISLWGCNAGAGTTNVAQDIANASGVPVNGYDNYVTLSPVYNVPSTNWGNTAISNGGWFGQGAVSFTPQIGR